MSNQLLI